MSVFLAEIKFIATRRTMTKLVRARVTKNARTYETSLISRITKLVRTVTCLKLFSLIIGNISNRSVRILCSVSRRCDKFQIYCINSSRSNIKKEKKTFRTLFWKNKILLHWSWYISIRLFYCNNIRGINYCPWCLLNYARENVNLILVLSTKKANN